MRRWCSRTYATRRAAALAKSLGERAHYVHLDVSSESEWAQALAAARQRFGPVTILVNNAGIYRTRATVEQSVDEYLQIIRINQLGTFLGMRTCFAQMRDAGGGSIVNIASTAGIEGVPLALAYTASKHAVVGMTKAAALEFGAAKVRVNVVCPGAMLTPLLVESLNVPLSALSAAPFAELADGPHGRPVRDRPDRGVPGQRCLLLHHRQRVRGRRRAHRRRQDAAAVGGALADNTHERRYRRGRHRGLVHPR